MSKNSIIITTCVNICEWAKHFLEINRTNEPQGTKTHFRLVQAVDVCGSAKLTLKYSQGVLERFFLGKIIMECNTLQILEGIVQRSPRKTNWIYIQCQFIFTTHANSARIKYQHENEQAALSSTISHGINYVHPFLSPFLLGYMQRDRERLVDLFFGAILACQTNKKKGFYLCQI